MPLTISDLAAAGEAKLAQLDAISHNLANVGTPGYKARRLSFTPVTLPEPAVTGETVAFTPQLTVDHRQGQLEKTGNTLDLALQGEGFFCVRRGEELLYTRSGAFTVNSTQQLTTLSGDAVQGENGPITIRGGAVGIDAQGVVTCDGSAVGKLKIVDFADRAALASAGDALFRDPGTGGPRPARGATVHAGYLEQSNVRTIGEMVGLIDVQRVLEQYQKLMQSIGEDDKLATSRVGRLA
jgi:flagellar basal-body rod protein FlgF